MATEIAAAYVSLVPSARGMGSKITRELSGIDTAAKSVGSQASESLRSRLTSGFSSTVSSMVNIAKRGGLLIGAGLAGAAGFGIKVAADFEQTRIAFEGILGSAAKADSFLSDLRKFAARTPFEFPGLADTAKNLLAVGFSADDVLPVMTTLGNVAATLGVGETEISGVVRALGQMKGKGKASAEELQQISEQIPGFSAIKSIAEGMGISVSDAFNKMADGAIPADEAIGFILEGMEKFPGAAGAMDRQSKTLNGVLSTFKDTLTTTAIDFITPYLPALSQGVQTFSGFITDTLVPDLASFVGFIGDLVDRYGPGVVSFFTDHLIPTVKGLASDGLEAVTSWWSRNGDKLTGFFVSFGAIALGVLGTVGDWIWDTGLPALDAFRDWFVGNQAAVTGVLAAIAVGFLIWATNAALAAAATVLANLPLVLLIGIIGLVAAGFAYAYTHSDAFRGVVDKVVPLVWSMVEGFFAMAAGIWSAVTALDELLRKLPGGGGLFGFFETGIKSAFPGLNLEGLAKGGSFGPGTYLVGEQGPEIMSVGRSGYMTPNSQIGSLGVASDGVHLHVTQLPGENQVDAGMRALKWHQTVQLASAGR